MDVDSTHVCQAFINKVLKLPLTYQGFPGGLPVSLSRDMLPNLHGITNEQTFVQYTKTFKTDGLRMYLGFTRTRTRRYVFTMDRRGNITQYDPNDFYDDMFEGTLFDGELKPEQTYFVIDCACSCGNDVSDKGTYPTRLEVARYMLAEIARQPGCHSLVATRPSTATYPSNFPDIIVTTVTKWQLKVKVMFYSNADLPQDWRWDDKEGLVWTLVTSPFHTYKCPRTAIIKWKYQQTIDFFVSKDVSPTELHVVDDVPTKYQQGDKGQTKLLVKVSATSPAKWFSTTPDTVSQNGIYECRWDGEKWAIINLRSDKIWSNNLKTITETVATIDKPILFHELV